MSGRQGWNLRGPHKVVLRGPLSPRWKGDDAGVNTKRERCQRAYQLTVCELCGDRATDRHHRDGDTGNNERLNVMLLCRRCHMLEDGRLTRFLSTSRSLRGPQPPRECSICHRLRKPLRKGRCHTCNEYWTRHGVECPYVVDGRREKTRKAASELPGMGQ